MGMSVSLGQDEDGDGDSRLVQMILGVIFGLSFVVDRGK